ncbi:MAG: TIGR03905 family TSCPD domain-containing protein [Muribaculaceae bacterium]|nr:TIGR03905 family TSCPD domain-containing protein [Muribaculaceae bacterium]
MKYTYSTTGTCSRSIEIETEDKDGVEVLKDVKFTGGCNGNLKGIGALAKGLPIEEVIQRLEGLTCKDKPTSCPDQLARALKEMKNN